MSGETPKDIVKSGWLIKQGGRVKTWKRRYFLLDSTGRLTYFASDEESKSESNRLGVINIKKALYVTPRSKDSKDSGNWPPIVPSEACFTIITNDRNYGMYGETEQEAHGWMKTLQAVRGGVDNANITALVEEQTTDRRPSITSSTLLDLSRQYQMLGEHIPLKVKGMFVKWHRVLNGSLKALADHFGCEVFTLKCNMGKMYQEAPRGVRNRLGELVFADYIDELRFNICKTFGDDPIAKEAFLAATSKRTIDFSLSSGSAQGDGLEVHAADGVIYVKVDPEELGKGIHLTGKQFCSTLTVRNTDTVSGGKVDGLPLSDVLDVIRARPNVEAVEKRLGDVLAGKKVMFSCNYQQVHESAKAGNCPQICSSMGTIIVKTVLQFVVAKVAERLGSASTETNDRLAGSEDVLQLVFRLNSNEKAPMAACFEGSGAELVISCGLEKLHELVVYNREPVIDLGNLLDETADSV